LLKGWRWFVLVTQKLVPVQLFYTASICGVELHIYEIASPSAATVCGLRKRYTWLSFLILWTVDDGRSST
jgi:hypothetical protein